ncbi:MAG: hypothetical protein OQL19_12780 [Gammaproteobacteria bacterium]|nr:hypothetical protein [Gammaproteobacteria bacterium]
MMNLKPLFLLSICLFGNLIIHNAIAFEEVIQEIGLEKIEAQGISFEQSHLCPYPIELKVKIFNDLKIAGLKKFSYRWIMNGEILETNGRFEVYPTAYGMGYDTEKTIVHVGQDPETIKYKYKENNPGINKLIRVFDTENPPNSGWYQFLALPAGETNWADAVKSNKAAYQINCKS